MSKTLGAVCALALAAAAPALASPGASTVAPYLHPARTFVTHAYRCYARSPNGSYGYSAWLHSLYAAQRQALYQCAVRTPRGLVCVITGCG